MKNSEPLSQKPGLEQIGLDRFDFSAEKSAGMSYERLKKKDLTTKIAKDTKVNGKKIGAER